MLCLRVWAEMIVLPALLACRLLWLSMQQSVGFKQFREPAERTPMLSIIYTSKATSHVTPEMVELISETSARNNRQIGVTGLLLYGSGNYLQVMEGEAEDVGSLFQRIQKDPRHTDCKVLHRQPTDKRFFEGWQMGMLNHEPGSDDAQPNEWDTITTMLQVMPSCGVLRKREDVVECIRDFICCHARLTRVGGEDDSAGYAEETSLSQEPALAC